VKNVPVNDGHMERKRYLKIAKKKKNAAQWGARVGGGTKRILLRDPASNEKKENPEGVMRQPLQGSKYLSESNRIKSTIVHGSRVRAQEVSGLGADMG